MKRRLLTAAATLAVMFSVASCTAEGDKIAYANQETRIEQFVDAALKAGENRRAVNEGGSIRIVLTEGEGEGLREGGLVSMVYAAYVFTGGTTLSQSQMFATNDMATAEAAGWDTSDSGSFKAVTLDLADDRTVAGLRNGLKGIKAGEECIILFSGKYGFGDRQSGMIPAKSALAYHIKAVSISND